MIQHDSLIIKRNRTTDADPFINFWVVSAKKMYCLAHRDAPFRGVGVLVMRGCTDEAVCVLDIREVHPRGRLLDSRAELTAGLTALSFLVSADHLCAPVLFACCSDSVGLVQDCWFCCITI